MMMKRGDGGQCDEYETGDDTIAVTILRASGELGDWGYFSTPEAQCLREFESSCD